MTKRQATTIWNLWQLNERANTLLSFIGVNTITITNWGNKTGELQVSSAVKLLREMADALEGKD